ncbi:MAG: ABC transporter substrate-binding protein [Caldilineae bacterium]|nr:MAG: ABC transporter substrate-binding protein [Caldilineae bacterium]
MSDLNRRDFLGLAAKGALGVAAVGLAGCAAPAAAPTTASEGEIQEAVASNPSLPTLEWQMATSWPLALDTIFGGAQIFAERVKALTNGKFVITPRAGGELAPGLEVLNVVEQGAVPIGHTASYYYMGKSPVTVFGTSLPFGMTARQLNAWFYEGGGLKLLQDYYKERFGVIQFPAGNTGAQMGGWWNKEIEKPSDLQGLKMRIPGLGGKVMAKLGVTVQVLPGGEIFQALQTGAIDAAEWVGPYDDEKLGLHDAAKYYYAPGWWEPGPALEVQINLNEFNKLPEEYQAAIETAAYQANMQMLARYDARNFDAMQRLLAGGTELRTFSDEILQAAEQASYELFDEFSQSDSDFKAVFSEWKKFLDGIQAWHATVETTYATYISRRLQ